MVGKQSTKRNGTLVLTGFISTGKTSAGKRIAERLALEFIDMDTLIEAREGRNVQALYRENGEAYLRERERELISELALRTNVVIATGGGALLDRSNVEPFSHAFVVCLDASLNDIVSRTASVQNRPILQGSNAQERIGGLLESRRRDYAAIPVHVDTSGMTVDEVVDQVIQLWQEHCEPYALY